MSRWCVVNEPKVVRAVNHNIGFRSTKLISDIAREVHNIAFFLCASVVKVKKVESDW